MGDEPTWNRVTSGALRDATGRGWEEWLQTLDDVGADGMDHRRIVAHLEHRHGEATTNWWRQTISVGYEQARGRRVIGETADAGFQIGVRRSFPLTLDEAWDLITTRPELWLGGGAAIAFDEGERYEVPPGDGTPAATGEVRVVKPGDRVRMTWCPDGWSAPATLQLALVRSPSGKTSIGVHVDKLPDAETREAMRERWKAALGRLDEVIRRERSV